MGVFLNIARKQIYKSSEERGGGVMVLCVDTCQTGIS